MRYIFYFILIPMMIIAGWKGNPRQGSAGFSKYSLYEYKQLDGNRINCTISSDGPYADYRKTTQQGMEWPKGSGKTPVFTAGFWLGGFHRPSGQLRMANMDFTSDYQPGPLLEEFNTTTNDDESVVIRSNDPRYRLYKINRSDANRGAYNPDYEEWPGDLGAPYVDMNGNGKWDTGIDMPKFYGDQQIWCVINDVNVYKHSRLSGTKPMGVEIQILYYVFNQDGPLGDVMFLKWKIINKSDADYDSVYLGLWSDPDLGEATDDLPGCDTLLNIGFIYNGDDYDEKYYGYGNKPPAICWDILAGPTISGSPTDSAFVNWNWIKSKRNLAMTSFIVYCSGTIPQLTDPGPDGSPLYAPQAYAYMMGMAGTIRSYIIDPNTGKPMKFFFAGDPLLPPSPQNALPANFPLGNFFPQEIRIMPNTGPFKLTKGDTQEIYATIILAQDENRLSSITKLKRIDRMVQDLFNKNLLQKPDFQIFVTKKTDSADVKVVSDARGLTLSKMTATLKRKNGINIAVFQLYDDGVHNDGNAFDGIWANIITLLIQQEGLLLDITLTDPQDSTILLPLIEQNITTAKLIISQPQVFSDNVNNDLKVNPMENIRYGFSIQNQNNFALNGLSLYPSKEANQKIIQLESLNPNQTYTFTYNKDNPKTYFSFLVPSYYPDASFTIPISVLDTSDNVWNDTLVFPVEQFIRRHPIIQQLSSEELEGNFNIIVTDPAVIKNHQYVIRGIDSINSARIPGYTLKDSTDGRIIIPQAPLPPINLEHSVLATEGFKILKGTMEYEAKGKKVILTPSTNLWFTSPISKTGALLDSGIYIGESFRKKLIGSSVPREKYHRVQITFIPKTGYVDENGNKIYDVGEKYYFDSTNSSLSQRAFFYASKYWIYNPSYEGYYFVPFKVMDIDVDPPEQLSVAILEAGGNCQWDLWKDYIFVMSTPYNDSEQAYDSTRGGTSVLINPDTLKSLPAYWVLWLNQRTGFEPYSSSITVEMIPNHPFSSRTVLMFNPTNVIGIDKEIVPSEFKLLQNYPNPFNPTTAISYTLSAVRDVSLKVFDVLGREIVTLVNERQKEGEYTVKWDATGFSSGVYFYQLRAGEFVKTKKMVFVR